MLLQSSYNSLTYITADLASRRGISSAVQLWNLTVRDDLSVDLGCTDGNGTTISEEHISYTDFPLPEIKFYVTSSTILLLSEY